MIWKAERSTRGAACSACNVVANAAENVVICKNPLTAIISFTQYAEVVSKYEKDALGMKYKIARERRA